MRASSSAMQVQMQREDKARDRLIKLFGKAVLSLYFVTIHLLIIKAVCGAHVLCVVHTTLCEVTHTSSIGWQRASSTLMCVLRALSLEHFSRDS